MRLRSLFLLGALTVAGCHDDQLAVPATPSVAIPPPSLKAAPGTIVLAQAPESGKVDRVGPDDGALRPDGVPDVAFVAEGEGPLIALFLVSVDAQGKPDGGYQADTLVGDTMGPVELGARPGGTTSGIGVVEEGNALLNAKDGSLTVLRAGPHRLTLYVAQTATLAAGLKLRLYAQRPDGTLVASAAVTISK